MADFSGGPPFGGQYNSLPYGPPFQQNPPGFNNMIPPPPHHFNQQPPSFPQNYPLPPGQPQYVNHAAYQANSQYPPQQYAQIPQPPIPPPPFYNNYNGYGNNLMYGNNQTQNGHIRSDVGYQAQAQSQQDQSARALGASDQNLNAKRNPEPMNLVPGLSQSSSGAMKNGRGLTPLQTSGQHNTHSAHTAPQAEPDMLEDDALALSGDESSAEQTPMQLDSATTNRSEPALGGPLNTTQSSQSSSAESFDPYSVPAYQSLDGTNENASIPTTLLPQPAVELPQTLDHDVPIQPAKSRLGTDLRNIHQDRKLLAIQAIQDLASRRIGFSQISEEDVDMEILKQLYEESGVPMDLPTVPVISQPRVPDPQPVPLQVKPLAAQVPMNKVFPVPAELPTITAVPNFNLPLTTVAKPSLTVTKNNPPAEVPKAMAPAGKEIPESLSASSPVVDLSRQDYVAKLQAAKAAVNSNTAPIAPTPQIRDRSSYLARLQAAKEAGKQNFTAKSAIEQPQAEPQAAPQQNNDTTSAANNISNAKANIDALIRQKLEALKKTKLANIASDSQDAPSTESTNVATIPSYQDQRPSSSGQPSAIARLREPLRTFSADQLRNEEVSFFSPTTRKGFVGGIPGLPGITSPPTSSMATQPQKFDSVVNITTDGNRTRDDSQNTRSSLQSVAGSQPSPNAQESTLIQQVQTEPQSSRKRAVAADFITPASTKLQQTAPSGPISLVIDVSDEEVDHGETVDDLIRNATISERRGVIDLQMTSETSSVSNAYNTPPKVATPDLQAKEDAIRELKQRILAATLRQSGKATPGTPSTGITDTLATTSTEQAKNIEDRQAILKENLQERTAQEKALAAAKLQAQRYLEQSRRNQANLSIHAQRAQNDINTSGNPTSREQSLKRKVELETRLSTLKDVITTTEADLAMIQKEQEKLLTRMKQETTERAILMDELKELLQKLDAEASFHTDHKSLADVTNGPSTTIPGESSMQSLAPEASAQIGSQETEHQGERLAGQSIDEPVQILSSGSTSPSRSAIPGDMISSSGEISESDQNDNDEMQIDNDDTTDVDEYDPEAVDFSLSQANQHEAHEGSDDLDNHNTDGYDPLQITKVLSPPFDVVTGATGREPPTSYQLNIQSSLMNTGAISESLADDNSQRDEAGVILDDTDGHDSSQGSPNKHLVEAVAHPSDTDSMATGSPNDDSNSDIASELERELFGETGKSTEGETHDATESGGTLEDEAVVNRIVPSHRHFVPYESVLRNFGSYRFHPDFTTNVENGFHSLTFSHNIKPDIELCRWETAGGVCSDIHCEFQHFKDIGLNDNNLLLQLGSVTEGNTIEEKERYISGLRETINGMRSRGLKDVDDIATEIVAYRRNFLGDPSRVIANLSLS